MLELLLALSASVNRAIEVVRRATEIKDADGVVTGHTLPDWLYLLFSLVGGVFVAFVSNVNLFAADPQYAFLPPIVGLVITGLVIGGGSNVIHAAFDLMNAFKGRIETQPTTSSTSVTVTSEAKTPADTISSAP